MLRNSLLAVLSCVLSLIILGSSTAEVFAQSTPPGGIAGSVIGADGSVCPGTGYTTRVVPCIKNAIQTTVGIFMDKVYQYLSMAIYAAIILSVALYGAMTLMGALRKPAAETFVLLLKIGAVIYFTQNFKETYTDILNIMDELLRIVTNMVTTNRVLVCDFGQDVWARVDCALERVVGISDETLLTGGVFGLLLAFLFSGGYGFAFFLLGIVIVFTLILSIVHAVFIFINAYVAIAFMAIFAPLFIPMVLFRQTKPFFDKWVKLLLGFILQPIILFAYLALLLTAFDITVFSGERSLYRVIAGNEAMDPNFRIGHYAINKLVYKKNLLEAAWDLNPTSIKDTPEKTEETGMFGKMSMTKFVAKGLETVGIKIPVNASAIGGKRWLIAFLTAALMGYILYTTLKYIPNLGHEIVGGIFDSPNLAGGRVGGRMHFMPGGAQEANARIMGPATQAAR